MAENILKLDIVTPARLVAELEVSEVTLPGILGEIGVLPGHLPLVTTLKPGALFAKTLDGVETRMAIAEGFAVVMPDVVTILTDSAETSEEIDIEMARQLAKEAEDRLADIQHLDEDELFVFRNALDRAQTKIKIWEEREKRHK